MRSARRSLSLVPAIALIATLAVPAFGQSPGGYPAPDAQAAAPFELTPQQQADLDRVLARWQQQGQAIRDLRTTFKLWDHSGTFGKTREYRGTLMYSRPDRGLYRVEQENRSDDPRVEDWQDVQAEHFVCNGQSILEFRYAERRVIEHQLPPSLRGEAMANGPLPFLFMSQAATMKSRFWLRDITAPEHRQQGQTWLEIWPKSQGDAAEFVRAELILTADFLPHAVRLHKPNGTDSQTYLFSDTRLNDAPRFAFAPFRQDPYNPEIPPGFTRKVESLGP